MRKPLSWKAQCVGLALAVLAAWPAAAQAPDLAMLDSLKKGAWTLRVREGDAPQRICLRDGRELIQLRHPTPGCSRFIVEDRADEVVVQYTCRGNGYGRTSIRKESSELVQIDSQGIVDGLPFSVIAEARHGGAC